MSDKIDKLRGQPFIGKIQRYDDPLDLAYGDQIERKCEFCKNRPSKLFDPSQDCADILAKMDFGFKPNAYLPQQIDGKEVGYYCTHFVDFQAE